MLSFDANTKRNKCIERWDKDRPVLVKFKEGEIREVVATFWILWEKRLAAQRPVDCYKLGVIASWEENKGKKIKS